MIRSRPQHGYLDVLLGWLLANVGEASAVCASVLPVPTMGIATDASVRTWVVVVTVVIALEHHCHLTCRPSELLHRDLFPARPCPADDPDTQRAHRRAPG